MFHARTAAGAGGFTNRAGEHVNDMGDVKEDEDYDPKGQ
jgi:hypothetical protein